MLGLMQDWPLLCHRIIDHAAIQHGDRAVVSRSVEGPIHTTNYAEIRARALKVAQRLDRDGIKLGDRVATLAWNTWRHLEAWYGILGIGAVYHTVNPRLFPEQIAWIVNHAEDRVLMTDLTFVPLLEKLADKLPTIERYVVLTDAAHMPATTLRNAVPYEEWIAEADGDFAWKTLRRKYRGRHVLHLRHHRQSQGRGLFAPLQRAARLMAALPDAMGLSSRDVVLPVVPLFHANGWALAFSAPMAGATLVMPGPKLDGPSVYELLTEFKVTCTAAVPTVWLALLQHLEASGGKLPYLKRVVIGGSACPRAMTQTFQDVYGVEVNHAWGMTEMSPLGTLCTLKPEYAELDRRGAARHPDEAGPPAVRRRDEDHRRRRQAAAVGRQDLRPAQGARAGDRAKSLLQGRAATCSTTKASSTPATSPPSTATATCRSPTAPRTSSSPAANGSPRSTWKISRSAIPRWRRPPSSACAIRNGTSGRCW